MRLQRIMVLFLSCLADDHWFCGAALADAALCLCACVIVMDPNRQFSGAERLFLMTRLQLVTLVLHLGAADVWALPGHDQSDRSWACDYCSAIERDSRRSRYSSKHEWTWQAKS